ncbi:thioredoxin-like protein [Microdochium trichocladiopsis]|uniref:Thioredoxin-like protein n=1 Tax=Microdochium trichocladiopsis TaxID=1682393 RepID=A0A9P8YA82_9PEZI|nr:thioredoxin-like protein [Microdochium trichocladiopsis]KAH7034671.1 thioredoxin-like protein [Microdochium trichocladiopsis]
MASQQYILYDLASKPPQKAWSLNPWKTRLNLNYKKVDYKTVWLDYPELKSNLQPHFKQELELYTSPTVAFPNGEYVADSWVIAQKLEKEHPEPSLHLDAPYVAKVQDIVAKIMPHLKGITASQVFKNLLNEASFDYWRKTREERIGMTLEQAEAERTGLKVWQEAEAEFKEVSSWLKENEGPFFLGSEPSFADFQWAGFLLFWQRVGNGNYEHFKTVVGSDISVHERLLEAVKPWSARDDY